MTPKEIVERVKEHQKFGHHQNRSDIDHLLAIHAAAISLLEAVDDVSEGEHPIVFERRVDIVQERRANLAALCGWKAEDET